jgi:enoyl-CoA hydratase
MKSDIDVQERESGLFWISINRPDKHNALALSVLESLAAAVHEAAARPGTKVIIVRGAGDKYFAAGGDLVELSSVRTPAEIEAMADAASAALDALRRSPVPVVAYVNGDAIGGGAELAVACDLRVLAPHARIGFIQGRLSITTAWGGGPDLCALVGAARATRIMARCEMIGAAQAIAWGLADLEAVDGPDGGAFKGFLQPMLERTRAVLEGIKQQAVLFRDGAFLAERRAVERRHLVTTWSSAEHWQAVEGFLTRVPR